MSIHLLSWLCVSAFATGCRKRRGCLMIRLMWFAIL